MADLDEGQAVRPVENDPICEENINECEPEKKRRKTESGTSCKVYKLEERLNGILCCAVCLDLPAVTVFQVGDFLQAIL